MKFYLFFMKILINFVQNFVNSITIYKNKLKSIIAFQSIKF